MSDTSDPQQAGEVHLPPTLPVDYATTQIVPASSIGVVKTPEGAYIVDFIALAPQPDETGPNASPPALHAVVVSRVYMTEKVFQGIVGLLVRVAYPQLASASNAPKEGETPGA